MGINIKQLPIQVVNQIAAGEVIERPASVVKELLENARDSGADVIEVSIGFGGLNYIRVADNGTGIEKQDLKLAVAPHATSKINTIDDLYALASLGFRGEALASIGSVSRLTLLSQTASEDYANQLCVEGGQVGEISIASRSLGTTIDVRDLFYNTPVRKRFLKSASLEYASIDQIIKRFALSDFHITLRVWHNDKLMLDLPGTAANESFEKRLQKIFGKSFVKSMHAIDTNRAGMRLRGWISALDCHRSQNDRQWIYINQRIVKDRLLQHALKAAYEDLLPPGRHSSCVLFLEISPSEVDVNVHPGKYEVRFEQPRLVHDFIFSQLRESLLDQQQYSLEEPTSTTDPLKQPVDNRQCAVSEYWWQALNTDFAIFSAKGNTYMVDVERLYQTWLEVELEQCEYPLAKRKLFVPVSVACQAVRQNLLMQHAALLEKFGIVLDCVGDKAIAVRSVPEKMPQLDIQLLLERLLSQSMEISEYGFKLMLLESCMCDAFALSEEQQSVLIGFILDRQEKISNKSTCWVLLTPQFCRQIFER